MPFIGAKDCQQSRQSYGELGFEAGEREQYCEVMVNDELGFWLQKYDHKGWVNNSMIFLEIPDVDFWEKERHLKYKYVRFTEIKTLNGEENYLCTIHQVYCGISVN